MLIFAVFAKHYQGSYFGNSIGNNTGFSKYYVGRLLPKIFWFRWALPTLLEIFQTGNNTGFSKYYVGRLLPKIFWFRWALPTLLEIFQTGNNTGFF
jgi:uncharacterized membrane protein